MSPTYFEDEHYLITHKPPKLLVHASKKAEKDAVNFQELLSLDRAEALQAVHRLDRATLV